MACPCRPSAMAAIASARPELLSAHHVSFSPRASRSHGCFFTSPLPSQRGLRLNKSRRMTRHVEASASSPSSPSHADDAGRSRRREVLQAAAGGLAWSLSLSPFGGENDCAHALVFLSPPDGFRAYVDRLDGYSFFFPDDWVQVKGAGADSFFRDPILLDQNASVNISSPSSSRYKAVSDLGSPAEAGEKVLKQYITEFMSTRLGVLRESQLIDFGSRMADDGREYYDIQVNVRSYANSNQLAILPEDRVARLEWDRRYLVALGVANGRLYQLRLQTPERKAEENLTVLKTVLESFRVSEAGA